MNLSHRELILAVAVTLPSQFTKPGLAVACWRAHPAEFGMRAYDLPDTQRVYSKLDGMQGVVARGWIHRMPDGLYYVTQAGRAHLRGRVAA